MTQQEIRMSPFKIAMLKTGFFFKKHAVTFLVGMASGVGITLGVQHLANKEIVQSNFAEAPSELTTH